MTPYRRNKALRDLARKKVRTPMKRSLEILKIMIDAAIARGEKDISKDIAQFIRENETL